MASEGGAAVAAAMTKFGRSGGLSLVRRRADCRLLLWRNCNSTFTIRSGSLFASDGVAAKDSSSTLISLRPYAEHSFQAPRPLSSSASSFPAAAAAAANANGSGSVKTSCGGIVIRGKSQIWKPLIMQRSVGHSLMLSSSAQSPPPPPPSLPPPYRRENPPDATNPDPVTLQEQWRYATRMYSKWYAHAWGTAIVAGLSFYGLGWFIKGENPSQFGRREKKEEVLLKPE